VPDVQPNVVPTLEIKQLVLCKQAGKMLVLAGMHVLL
jgi:hypothetical protein